MSDASRTTGAREGMETTWLFLRTLVGSLAVGTLLPALFVPPDPLAFLVAVAILWLLGTVAAWWLTFADGYATLSAAEWYRPGMAHGKALVAFLGIALALKFGGTIALDQYVQSLPGYGFVEPQVGAPPSYNGTGNATGTGASTGTVTPTETPSPTPTATDTVATATAGGEDVTPVRDRPYAYDLVVSAVALVVASWSVYTGRVAWLLGEDDA